MPIACRLTPDDVATMPARLDGYRRLGRDALIAVDHEPRRATLRFRDDPRARAGVEELVALESRCCAFLDFEIRLADGAITLEIATPSGGEAMLRDLVGVLADRDG